MLVAPLRKQRLDGRLYCRPSEIETELAVLLELPAPELVERACIDDKDDPLYVRTECVLYFLRRPTPGLDGPAMRTLFTVLRQRVLRAVPVPKRRLAGSSQVAECSVDLEIRDRVLHRFQAMLCKDRREYEEKLDYYECRFQSALAKLRAAARRRVHREASRYESLDSDNESNEPSADVKSALAALKTPSDGTGIDFLYRRKLLLAISSLPEDERRVVELILKEFPIESQDPAEQTIVKIIGCVEKTVRNRRDRAFAKLRDALKEEEA